MSSRFLSSDSTANLAALQDGTFELSVASAFVSELTPSLPVKTNADKKLISGLINLNDINATLLTNPYVGTLEATALKTASIENQISSTRIDMTSATDIDFQATNVTVNGQPIGGGITDPVEKLDYERATPYSGPNFTNKYSITAPILAGQRLYTGAYYGQNDLGAEKPCALIEVAAVSDWADATDNTQSEIKFAVSDLDTGFVGTPKLTIGDVVTVASDLEMSNKAINNVASMNGVVYVRSSSDFPPVVSNRYLLVANTQYVIVGTVTIFRGFDFSNGGCSITGVDLGTSTIVFNEAVRDIIGFYSRDANVYVSNLTIQGGGGHFSSSGTSGIKGLFDCEDYNVGEPAPFYGRNRRFRVFNCNILSAYKLGSITGFGTLNIGYNFINGGGGSASGIYTVGGFVVKSGLSLEFANNKMVLFAGAQIPSTAVLLTLDNDIDALLPFNAVVITSNIFHPRGTENAIKFENGSRTGLGNISGNTFIRTGGTSALIDYQNQSGFDNYSPQSIVNYDIDANSGIVNSSPLLKSIVGLGLQITNPVNWSDLPFVIANIGAIKESKRFGLEITMLGTTGGSYTAGNYLESTTGGGAVSLICSVGSLNAGSQTIRVCDMGSVLPDVLTYRELDTALNVTGVASTSIENGGLGSITPVYSYYDKDPRQVILQASLSYQNDTKDETVEFRPMIALDGINFIDTDDCAISTTAVKQNQYQSITLTCAISCIFGTKLKFQVKQVAPDVANVTVGKMVITMK